MKVRILNTNKLLREYLISNLQHYCGNINEGIDDDYFLNNDNNVTDDFNYFIKRAFKITYPSMNLKHTTNETEKLNMSPK